MTLPLDSLITLENGTRVPLNTGPSEPCEVHWADGLSTYYGLDMKERTDVPR